jgi:hypothetical protein
MIPSGSTESAFLRWDRKTATQLVRYSVFVGRARQIILKSLLPHKTLHNILFRIKACFSVLSSTLKSPCGTGHDAGHMAGEALVRTFRYRRGDDDVIGLDIKDICFHNRYALCTTGRSSAPVCMPGVEVVYHMATLHKPHVATHSMQDFIDTYQYCFRHPDGIVLEEAKQNNGRAFVFASTRSVFGETLRPPTGSPAIWVTEDINRIPKIFTVVPKHLRNERPVVFCFTGSFDLTALSCEPAGFFFGGRWQQPETC